MKECKTKHENCAAGDAECTFIEKKKTETLTASMLDVHIASKWEATHTWQPASYRARIGMGKVQGQVEKEEALAELVNGIT